MIKMKKQNTDKLFIIKAYVCGHKTNTAHSEKSMCGSKTFLMEFPPALTVRNRPQA